MSTKPKKMYMFVGCVYSFNMTSRDPDLPYQDLPLLPPAADIETKKILKAVVAARSSLATLNESCMLIPNPTVLINSIPILEAQASSEIENIVTTTDELFKYSNMDLDTAMPSATKETLRYRSALRLGFESLASRPLTKTTAINICSHIQGKDMRIRDLSGTKIANPTTQDVIYTPPEGSELIKDKLSNWETFIHAADDVDPLVKMAVARFYQFEAIHPFFDGNGRTGRILNILILVEKGLLALPVLYLSRHIVRHKGDYYRLLNGVTRDDAWEDWILFMITAVEETANWTRNRIRQIRELRRTMADDIREHFPHIYSQELLDVLFEQPYSRIDNVVERGLAQRQTASVWLRTLAEAGLLEEIKVGRSKVFVNKAFYDLLIRPED